MTFGWATLRVERICPAFIYPAAGSDIDLTGAHRLRSENRDVKHRGERNRLLGLLFRRYERAAPTLTCLSAIEVRFLSTSPSSWRVSSNKLAISFSPSRRAKLQAV